MYDELQDYLLCLDYLIGFDRFAQTLKDLQSIADKQFGFPGNYLVPSLNQTTVLVVLFLVLWFLFICAKNSDKRSLMKN